MKMKHLYLSSLTSLAVMASTVAFAEEDAYAPSLEGGFYGSVGTFYAVPSDANSAYGNTIIGGTGANPHTQQNTVNATSDYDWGFEAMAGYAFEGTANSIELSYRGLNSDGNDSVFASSLDLPLLPTRSNVNANATIKDEFNNWDLMITQYLDIGTHMQMRFLAGLSYLSELEQDKNSDYLYDTGSLNNPTHNHQSINESSSYNGWGPRLGIDARYDFGDSLEGFGIVAAGSAAYFLGDLDVSNTQVLTRTGASQGTTTVSSTDTPENHTVTNLRANLGIDYVYYFGDEESVVGVELGYQVDTYFDGIASTPSQANGQLNTYDITFSGPYLNLKGAF